MKLKIVFYTICLLGGSTALFSGGPRSAIVVEEGDDYDDDNVIWIGPGWYGGVWIENEDGFNNWYWNRHRDGGYGHHGGHGHGDYGHGHGGGGHHSGGHGGGGHH